MIVSRAEVNPRLWDAFVAQHPDGWVWHLTAWLDYLHASGRLDDSVAEVDAHGIIGLCPALLPVPADDPLPAPLGEGWQTDWPTRNQPTPTRLDGSTGFYTHVVDLSRPPADLWREIRRSYHSPIRRVQERYVIGEVSVATLASLYHQQPDLPQLKPLQWRCIERLAHDGHVRAYGATAEGCCDAAIGVYFWKGMAYYASGRSLVPSLNPALHWHAFGDLPRYGVRFYETGWEARPGDDEKARNIAYHKVGLGGDRWWVRVT
jgi:hypothetical protein